MSELKPCPFCGRTPKVLHRTDSLDGYFCAISCFCGGCSARAHQAATGADEHEAYVKAALRWNRRPESESKPLTLEELRERDGKPVWIVAHPDWGHWELSEDAEDYFEDRDEDFYGMSVPPTIPDPMGRYGLHMLGWLAYDHPPKED